MPRRRLIIATAFMFSLSAFAELPAGTMLIAHRGVVTDTLDENSLPALEETIRRGYSHVEVDLQVTKDGHAVVLHDRNLQRTTGIDKNIDDVTLAELREMVSEERVPSFETFAARCAGRIDLMPDVKGFPSELREAFLHSLETSMKKHGLIENALFIGRKDAADHFWGRSRQSWRRPLDAVNFEGEVAKNPGKYYFVFGHAKDFDAESVRGFQELGLQVVVSINTFHYTDVDPIQQGLTDVQTMLDCDVDGLQIDSVYDVELVEQE